MPEIQRAMLSMPAIKRRSAITDSKHGAVGMMANLLVRGLDETVAQNRREQAAARGRSAGAKHRQILARALRRPRRRCFAEALMRL